MFNRIKAYLDDYKEMKKNPEPLNHVFVEKEPTKRKMRKKINTLEGEVAYLKSTIEEELYKTFMEKLGEPLEIERLRNENKKLRKKVNMLKELLKEDSNARGNRKKNK